MTNINQPFISNFFLQIRPPNVEELIEKFTSMAPDKENPDWASKSCIKTTTLPWRDYVNDITPILSTFSDMLNVNLNIDIQGMWLNHYEHGGYQEIHDHGDSDFSGVMFLNDGPNFSKFFFYDRMSFQVGVAVRKILNIPDSWYYPSSPGDVIIFPSTFCHGVTRHESDIVRKTLSFNLKVKKYD